MKRPAGKLKRWHIAAGLAAGAILIAGALWLAFTAAFPPARLAAMLGDEVRRTTGRDFRIGGSLSFRLLPTLAVVAEDITIGNAAWGSQADMVRVRRIAFEIALRPLLDGEVRVLRLGVEDVDLLLETDPAGRANWHFATVDAPGGSKSGPPPAIDLEGFSIAGARIRYRSGPGSEHGLTIAALRLDKAGERTRISATAEFDRRRWQLDGQAGHPADLLRNASDWPFDLQLATEGARLSARGHLAATEGNRPLRTEVAAHVDNLAAFAGSALPAMPFTLAATLALADGNLQAEPMRVTLSGQEVTGRLHVADIGGARRIDAQLASPLLDLRKPPAPPAAKPAPAGRRTVLSTEPLPIAAALPGIPVHIVFAVERLLLPDLPPLSALAGEIRGDPGQMEIGPLSFGLAGGRMEGRLAVAQSKELPPHIRLEVAATNLALDEARAAGVPKNLRGGRADVNASLEVRGLSPHAMAETASGSILVTVRDTSLAGGKALDRNPLEALMQALIPGRPAEERLAIDCLVANLPLRDGRARIDRGIALETRDLAVAASGEIDFGRETLTLVFEPYAKKGLGLNQASLAQLVMLKGPLADPKIGLDPKGAAQEMATLGIAFATGGMSLVAGRMLGDGGQGNACRLAISGRPTRSTATGKEKAGNILSAPADLLRKR